MAPGSPQTLQRAWRFDCDPEAPKQTVHQFVRDRQTKERADTERDAVVVAAFRRGLVTLGAGRNAIRLSPPLVFTKGQADIALKLLDEAFTEVERRRR